MGNSDCMQNNSYHQQKAL